jgi:hypothetical protein
MFEQTGVHLMEIDTSGQTLLHMLVSKETSIISQRVGPLLSKGFDPLAKNNEGRTVIDVAVATETWGTFYQWLPQGMCQGEDLIFARL